jgi:predicted DNA-binding protein
MKTFSRILSEVAQPNSEDELNFKEKHVIDPIDHTVAPESTFSGAVDKDDVDGMKRYRKNKRLADYQRPDDEAVYEGIDLKRDIPGQEDDDVDNDGDKDMTDAQYKYRKHAQIKMHKIDEAKLSPEKQERLDTLISNVMMTTAPDYYGNDTPQKYLKAIEKEFGATIAKQVDDGSYKIHWGRDNHSSGMDKLASRQWSSNFKGGPRVTAAGKMNKQDVGALKTRIKNDKKFGGLLKSVKLPEEVKLDEAVYVIPEEILATEKNAFHTAAANAHAAGKKHFAFAGKKYPVTMSKGAAKTFSGKGGMSEGMDPVGKEDDDINNDGKVNKSDKYLHARRKAISSSIRTKIKEGFGPVTPAGGEYDSEESHQRYKKSNSSKKEDVALSRDGQGSKIYAGKTKESQIDELDEVSTATLQRYKSAASKAMDRASDSAIDKMLGSKDSQSVDISKEKKTMDKRSKGVSLASNKLAKEEVEELDELSKKTLGSYVKKASRNLAGREYKRGAEKDTSTSNLQKSYKRDMGIAKAVDKLAKEEVELDEANYIGDTFIKHLKTKYNDKTSLSKSETKDAHDLVKRMSNDDKKKLAGSSIRHVSDIAKDHIKRYIPGNMKKEEVELDESWSDGVSSRNAPMHARDAAKHRRNAQGSSIAAQASNKARDESGYNKHMAAYHSSLAKALKSSYHAGEYGTASEAKRDHKYHMSQAKEYKSKISEDVEQINELKKSTLGSYVKKAAGSMAGKTAVAAAQASSSMKKSSPDITRGIVNRMKGITRATDKLTKEEVELDEVSKSTLGSYATKALRRGDIAARMSHSDSDEMGKIANKRLTGAKQAVDKLAPKGAATRIKTSIDKAREAARNRGTEKDDKGKAYYAAQKGIAKVREEVEQIDELDKKTLASYVKKSAGVGDRNSLPNAMRDQATAAVTGDREWYKKSGRTATNRSTGIQRAADRLAKEEVELDEAFNAGLLKLNDGSSISVNSQDAKLLNQLINGLRQENAKKMMKVAMTDKDGFKEILGFAREAL